MRRLRPAASCPIWQVSKSGFTAAGKSPAFGVQQRVASLRSAPDAPMSAERRHQHLTDEELAEFREIFNLVDLDKGGTISKDELKQLMNTLGLKPSQVQRPCGSRGVASCAPAAV